MPDRTLIVGSGAAGSIVAARSTERSDREVLLVEAGPDYPDLAQLPADLVDGTRNAMTSHDYGYHHQPTREGMPMPFPRGRVVGGSSAVNTCIALRGQDYDYDEWAALGLPEWSFARCMPAFTRLEDDRDFGDRPYHGIGGPIPVRRHRPNELATFQAAFLEACRDLGFDDCPDTNDPDGTGAGPHAMNKIDGVRQSAARCCLTPAVRARENLRIVPNAQVVRVLFAGKRVHGIEVRRGSEVEVLEANRVVLCAGAIDTPKVLLRSGIGPRDELARHGVDPVAIVPGVAHHLLDHPGFAIFLLPKHGVVKPRDPLIQTVTRYRPARGRRNEMQIQPGSFVPLWVDVPLVSLMSSLGKPSGHGTLRFPSLALEAKPIIDCRFLEHPDDLHKACEAIELMGLLASSKAIRDVARPLIPDARMLDGHERITRFVRKQTASGYHPCGTAKMGADDDPLAVCDQYGRVRGVDGLIIADASLMPTVPTANTHFPTLMIGERFGEWVRDGRYD